MNNFIKKIKIKKKKFQFLVEKKIVRYFLPVHKTKALFVVGNQRSGTTMFLRELNKHIDVDVYGEVSNAMKDWRIKELDYIEGLVNNSKAKIVVFKPLEDSHRTIEFLNKFENSQAIWLFRYFSDIVNSSMRLNWGKHCKEYVQKIHNNEYFEYCEPLNLTDKNVRLIKELYEPKISPQTCIALIWYLRNTIYFDYNMRSNANILLVCYEFLVSNPKEQLVNILNFIGLQYKKRIEEDIHSKSIKKQDDLFIRSDVKMLCETLYNKLINALQ